MEEGKAYCNPQVLLLGNGINQLNGGVSWNDFLREIATKKEIVDGVIPVEALTCPEPLKAILVTEDHVDVAMQDYCNRIAFREQTEQVCVLYKKLLSLGFDDVLTTNYTYELEIAASTSKEMSRYRIEKLMRHTDAVKQAERKYLLHTYNQLAVDGCINRVWHIHGEARKPDSTVLGHYYYGNLLCKIKEYLHHRNYAENKEMKSWVDSFIMGDVYILGFGFGFSELDLWWLLNRKAREKSATGKVYFYEAEPVRFDEKQELLRMLRRAYDGEAVVEIVNCGYKKKIILKDGVEKTVLDGRYEDFYNDAIADIAGRINGRK